jgi:hypothetical protein
MASPAPPPFLQPTKDSSERAARIAIERFFIYISGGYLVRCRCKASDAARPAKQRRELSRLVEGFVAVVIRLCDR